VLLRNQKSNPLRVEVIASVGHFDRRVEDSTEITFRRVVLRIKHTQIDAKSNEIGATLEPSFMTKASTIGIYRLHREMKSQSNFLMRVSLDQETQYIILPTAEMKPVGALRLMIARNLHGWVNNLLTAPNFAKRVQKYGNGAGLE
jgi:hypothetical protein